MKRIKTLDTRDLALKQTAAANARLHVSLQARHPAA